MDSIRAYVLLLMIMCGACFVTGWYAQRSLVIQLSPPVQMAEAAQDGKLKPIIPPTARKTVLRADGRCIAYIEDDELVVVEVLQTAEMGRYTLQKPETATFTFGNDGKLILRESWLRSKKTLPLPVPSGK